MPAPGRIQATVRTVTDGAGGVVIAWTDGRDAATTHTDIYAQNAFADGPLFEDGFESRNTSPWSGAVP